MICRRFLLLGLCIGPCFGALGHRLGEKTGTPSTHTLPPARITPSALAKRQESGSETCGYVDGEDQTPPRPGDREKAVTCDPGNCGFISVPGASQLNAVCCSGGICEYHTTCVESRQQSSDDDEATPDFALVCSETSLSCVTYTWPDISAEAYGCSATPSIITVSTPSTSTGQTSSVPTQTSGGDDHGDSNGDGPGLGQEYDLSASQRIGAGVGSGIMSALMLGFFIIFGCLLQLPARDESNSLTAQTSNEEPRSRAAGRHIDAHSQYPVMGDGFQRESITPEQIKVAASNTYPQMSQSRGLV